MAKKGSNNKKKKTKKKHRFFWFVIKCQIVLIVLVLAGLGYFYFGGYAHEVEVLKEEAIEMVDGSTESTFKRKQINYVYDTNGDLISKSGSGTESTYIAYEDIPAEVKNTIISIEDKKFYKHNGVDYKALVRAAKSIAENGGEITQGGSTITMQLARNIYLDNDKNWRRKVQEIYIAWELEKRYSKEKILEYYLNNIYFSNGYYGIGAACKGYFNCELSELSISEIAFLCAIPNSPTYYDPLVNYDNTIKRRNLILKNLYEDGKIDEATYNEALEEEIILNPAPDETDSKSNYTDTYTYYCATRIFMELEGFEFQYYFENEQQKADYDVKYQEMYDYCQQKLYSGGYKIYTSFDMNIQTQLQSSLDAQLSGFTELNEDGTYAMQGSAVCIDNQTGLVAAMVGGRSQDLGMYTLNRAYQSHRQPGSAIKPLIVYTPIFEQGYTPESMVYDHEFDGGPKNSGGVYYGDVNIRFAVEKSLNTVAWQLYTQITPTNGLEYLKNMNFTHITKADEVPATSIGGFSKGVSALEMAAGYATIANDGRYREPNCIVKIVDADQNVVYVNSTIETVIYKETAARMMTNVLNGVMLSGTGKSCAIWNMPCAGKTGTTNDNKDGWFVGYTRYYTTSVWVGYDYPRAVSGLQGASYPGKIWQQFMYQLHDGLTPLDFLPYAQLSDEFMQELEEQEEDTQTESESESESESDNVSESESQGDSPEADSPVIEGDEPQQEPQ